MTPKCKSCKYHTKIGSGVNICDYICVTGEPRECPVEMCDKYVKGTHPSGKDNMMQTYIDWRNLV